MQFAKRGQYGFEITFSGSFTACSLTCILRTSDFYLSSFDCLNELIPKYPRHGQTPEAVSNFANIAPASSAQTAKTRWSATCDVPPNWMAQCPPLHLSHAGVCTPCGCQGLGRVHARRGQAWVVPFWEFGSVLGTLYLRLAGCLLGQGPGQCRV